MAKLKEFLEQIASYIEEIGLRTDGRIASHDITAYLAIEDEDGNTFSIKALELDRLSCGCASGFTLIIKPEESTNG